jgi:hypothetical protein
MAITGPKVASPRANVLPLTRAAYIGDGKWHHFGESQDLVATKNRGSVNLAAALGSSSPSSVAIAFHGAEPGGK